MHTFHSSCEQSTGASQPRSRAAERVNRLSSQAATSSYRGRSSEGGGSSPFYQHTILPPSPISPTSPFTTTTTSSTFEMHQEEQEEWMREAWDRMEDRRRQFEEEVARQRMEFFQQKPYSPTMMMGEPLIASPRIVAPTMKQRSSSATRSSSNGGPVISQTGRNANVLPVLAGDKFERDANGQLVFRLRFDVSDFDMDDIRVTTKEDRLTVAAKKNIVAANASSSKEFVHTMDLPVGVLAENLSCKLTDNGILVLSAPVVSNSSLTPITQKKNETLPRTSSPRSWGSGQFSSSRSVSDKDESTSQYRASNVASASFPVPSYRSSSPHANASCAVPVHNLLRPSIPLSSSPGFIANLPDGSKEFQLSVEMGDEFLPHEITVKTNEHKVFVHAKHEERSPHRTVLREFTKDFDIPQQVNPQTVTAKFKLGVLYLSAPVMDSPMLSSNGNHKI